MILNRNAIDEIAHDVCETLKEKNLKKEKRIRAQILLEDILLRYLENGFENAEVSFKVLRRFHEWRILVSIKGERKNFTTEYAEDQNIEYYEILNSLLTTGDIKVSYRHQNSENRITLITEHKPENKTFFSQNPVLVAALVGIVLSVLAKLLFPEAAILFAENGASVFNNTLLSILKSVTIFYAFTSLVCGIVAMEDIKRVSTVGIQVILRFVSVSALLLLFTMAVCYFFFSSHGAGSAAVEVGTLFGILISVIPTNPIEPFLSGNMIQIIMIGFLLGISLLVLGDKLKALNAAMYEGNELFGFLLKLISKLIPVIVFLSIFDMIVTTDITALGSVWKCAYLDLIIGMTICIFCVGSFCVRYRQKIGTVWHQIRPAVMLAFMTGSSSVTIPKMYELSETVSKPKSKIASYWIPLSYSLFSPSNVTGLAIYAFFAAEQSNTAITPMMLILMFVIVLELGIATPKIPGGILAMITLLLTQLGISTNAIGLIVAANIFLVNFSAAVGTVVRCTELLRAEMKYS